MYPGTQYSRNSEQLVARKLRDAGFKFSTEYRIEKSPSSLKLYTFVYCLFSISQNKQHTRKKNSYPTLTYEYDVHDPYSAICDDHTYTEDATVDGQS